MKFDNLIGKLKSMFLMVFIMIFLSITVFCGSGEKKGDIGEYIKKISWLKSRSSYGSCSVQIVDEKVIYIDPVDITDETAGIKADIILISHEHSDHLQYDSLVKLKKASTLIIANEDIIKTLKSSTALKGVKFKAVKYNEKVETGGFKIESFAAYSDYHPKKDYGLGYIITNKNGIRIYVSGATGYTDEMKNVKNIDIALFYVKAGSLAQDEGIKALNAIKPSFIIPLHWKDYETDEVEFLKKNMPQGVALFVIEKK